MIILQERFSAFVAKADGGVIEGTKGSSLLEELSETRSVLEKYDDLLSRIFMVYCFQVRMN